MNQLRNAKIKILIILVTSSYLLMVYDGTKVRRTWKQSSYEIFTRIVVSLQMSFKKCDILFIGAIKIDYEVINQFNTCWNTHPRNCLM